MHNCCENSQKVYLSCDKSKSPVQRLTFTIRNIKENNTLKLFISCKKESQVGNCHVGITYYSCNTVLSESNPFKYEILSDKLTDYIFSFNVPKNATKAEITTHCTNNSSLYIEKINTSKE